MPKLTPDTIMPTPEEDAAINAGIAADPDTEELDDAWFARARPASVVDPGLVERVRRGRGRQTAPTKEPGHDSTGCGHHGTLSRRWSGLADTPERRTASRSVPVALTNDGRAPGVEEGGRA